MTKKKLKVLDLFAGTRSVAKAAERAGHETFSVELDEQHEGIDLYANILDVTPEMIIEKFGVPDVIHGSPPCFTGETLVLTDKGFKEIRDIKLGDKVITHTNTYQTVTDFGSKLVNKKRVIRTTASFDINTTDNHPFYVRKNYRVWNNDKRGWDRVREEPQWVKAKDLEKTWLVGHAINQNENIPQWEGTTYEHKNKQGQYPDTHKNELGNLMENKDFWWLIGRYIGDGYYRYELNEQGKSNRYEFILTCDHNEKDEILSVLDKVGVFNPYIEKGNTATKFKISKKELVEFVLQFGKYAHGKRLTNTIFDLPIDLLQSFLQGYFSADGHIYTRPSGTKVQKACSVSKELLYGIGQCVVKAYQLPFSLKKYSKPETYVIEGRTVNQRDIWELSYSLNPQKAHSFVENGILWSPIKEIEEVEEEVRVYNMTVENDNSYTANGAIVHNCQSFSVAAIGKNWTKHPDGNVTPKHERAELGMKLVQHTLWLIKELNPKVWYIENPRGMLRKMPFMQEFNRHTVGYCSYGDTRQKPTDIWSSHANIPFKPLCKPGSDCHVAAPRGSSTGTQGIKNVVDRSRIPDELCDFMIQQAEKIIEEGDE